MKYEKAKSVAEQLTLDFAPYCERIEIAGSIRREKPIVGDIEIVATPILARDLFGALSPGPCVLDHALNVMVRDGYLGKVLKNGLRYKQFELPQGIELDLFIVRPPAQWGVIFAIRTGPRAFSRWIVTQRRAGGALPSGFRVKDGAVHLGLTGNSRVIPMPEEMNFLKFVGLGWIAPAERRPNLPLQAGGVSIP